MVTELAIDYLKWNAGRLMCDRLKRQVSISHAAGIVKQDMSSRPSASSRA